MLSCAIVALTVAVAARAQLDPEFYSTSGSWGGVCNSGTSQTPINIKRRDAQRMPNALVSTFTFPQVSGVKLKNKGTALQVRICVATPCICRFVQSAPR